MQIGARTKKAGIIIAVVLVVLVAVSLLRDLAIKQVITVYGGHITGTTVTLDAFSLSLVRQSVAITGFTMHHPPGFEKGMMIDLPRMSLDVDALGLLKGKLHVQSAALSLKEMVLIRNREGKLNVDSLKIAQKKPDQQKQEPKKPQKKMPMQIDLLTLELGKVVMKDYTRGTEPKVTVYDLNIKKTYKNITSAEQLAALIMIEPMKSAGITGAAIYGAAAVAGVGLLPAVAVVTLAGKDSSQQEFNSRPERVYAESLNLVNAIGKVKSEDKAGGLIKASVQGTDMTITVEKKDRKTLVTVAARRYMIPKPKEASGFLFRLAERLKEK